MRQQKLLLTLGVAMLLAVPAASATWYVHGTFEPDTAQDAAGNQMYVDPDTSGDGRKVYFNVWADEDVIGVNPNAGAAGSAVFPTPNIRFSGMLGVWKDCNLDGFVGAGDGALWEYRRELLATVPATPCDEDNGHVVGDWVWEFHWIGPFDDGRPTAKTCPGPNGEASAAPETSECFYRLFGPQNYINDTDSRVWGDWGLPGEKPGASCTVLPPAGMTASTGGVIDFADCHLNRRVQQGVNSIDSSGSLGLRMDDRPQTSDSLLNQQLPHLWEDPYHPDSTGAYERDSGDPAFETWDCSTSDSQQVSEDRPVEDEAGLIPNEVWANDTGVVPNYYVATLKGSDGRVLNMSISGQYVNTTQPAPRVNNPQGSYWDGINETHNGAANRCTDQREGGVIGTDYRAERWDRWDFPGVVNNVDWYVDVEQDIGSTDPNAGRREHDVAFAFRSTQGFPLISLNYNAIGGCTGTSNGQPFPPGCQDYPTNNIFPINMPKDFGITAHRGLNFIIPGVINSPGGVGWRATAPEPADPQVVDRETLQPKGPIYATFYATLGAATLGSGVTVPGPTNLYGAEWCGSATSGVVDGFDCNAENWWNPLTHPGTSAMPIQRLGFTSSTCETGREEPLDRCRELGVKPGQPYQLRDIDCWDGRIASGVPVYASLVTLSGQTPCAAPQ